MSILYYERNIIEECLLTGITKPDPPTIDVVNETSIKVKLSIPWKDEYKGLLLSCI